MAGSSSIYIVTICRSERSEPEAYYMPAPTPQVAELRVRRLAKAPGAAVLSVDDEAACRAGTQLAEKPLV